jgi:replicative DNA helicase
VLPNNLETENTVLGEVLLESTAINQIADILPVEAFYNPDNAEIYQAVLSLYEKGNTVDMLSVTQHLIGSGKNDVDFVKISSLTSNVASTTNILDHAMYLHQLWLHRQVIAFGQSLIAKGTNQSFDIGDTIDEAIKGIEHISDKTCYNASSHRLGDAAYKAIDLYGERKVLSSKGITSGINTGLNDLNVITNGGWKANQLIILAARPAMGKTALLLYFAKAAALSGVPVMIFSLEMDVQGLTNRLLLSECEINQYNFQVGKLSYEEERSLCASYGCLNALPVMIDDTAGISIHQIKTRARNAKLKGKCGIVFIDYLQLIDVRSHNKNYNREQEIAQTSRAAKIMAKELGIPVILLSQLSREVEKRGDKIPTLSDLRESGAIEQDADMVLFIHRPEYYTQKDEDKDKGILRVAKQRDGATGDIAFKYNKNITKIAGFDDDEPMPF